MDPNRRQFLRGARPAQTAPSQRPPWAVQPQAAFAARCTACGDCVRACPAQVLYAGADGLPLIQFNRTGCTLCGDCAGACPSGALQAGTAAAAFPWRVRVSPACLTQHRVECRVCGDVCDARALRFAPARGGIAQLHIDSAACTGCGQCVAICPAQAIQMAPATMVG